LGHWARDDNQSSPVEINIPGQSTTGFSGFPVFLVQQVTRKNGNQAKSTEKELNKKGKNKFRSSKKTEYTLFGFILAMNNTNYKLSSLGFLGATIYMLLEIDELFHTY